MRLSEEFVTFLSIIIDQAKFVISSKRVVRFETKFCFKYGDIVKKLTFVRWERVEYFNKQKKFLKRDVDSDSYANLCRAFEKYLFLPNGILLTPTKKLQRVSILPCTCKPGKYCRI